MIKVYKVNIGYDKNIFLSRKNFFIHVENADRYVDKFVFMLDGRRLLTKGKTSSYFETEAAAHSFVKEMLSILIPMYEESKSDMQALQNSANLGDFVTVSME